MRVKQKEIFIGYILLLITIVLWASAFVGIRIGLRGYSPGTLALFRFLVASVTMIPVYLKYRTSSTMSPTDRLSVFFLGLIGIGIYHTALNYGELTVSAGLASFIIGLSPIFTALFAITLLKEKLPILGWVGIAISISGVFLITISQGESIAFERGIFCVLIAAIISGIYAVWQKSLLGKINAYELTALIIWSGTIGLLLFLPELPHTLRQAPVHSTIAIIYLGIFPGAIAYTTWSMALKRFPSTKACSALYAMPIFSSLLGWLVLNETIILLSFVGGCIALIGTMLVQTQKIVQ